MADLLTAAVGVLRDLEDKELSRLLRLLPDARLAELARAVPEDAMGGVVQVLLAAPGRSPRRRKSRCTDADACRGSHVERDAKPDNVVVPPPPPSAPRLKQKRGPRPPPAAPASSRPTEVACVRCGNAIPVGRSGPIPKLCPRPARCRDEDSVDKRRASRRAVQLVTAAAPVPPPSAWAPPRLIRAAPVRLEVFAMAPGAGERRENCARYVACLDAFLKSPQGRRGADAHCPEGCAGYAAAPLKLDHGARENRWVV